jgi:hypothetical protein
MSELPPLEVVEDRLQGWEDARERALRALEYADRQIENCHRMKRLISGVVTLVLLHGGECE